jgi:maltose alpha-D-glucosyltransferase / alpha-amylase
VADQRRDPTSLLSWMERAIRRRRETPEFGWGDVTLLETGEAGVLGHRCDWSGRSVLALHNLTAEPRELQVQVLAPDGPKCRFVDLLDGTSASTESQRGRLELKLEGYGFRWFAIEEPDAISAP